MCLRCSSAGLSVCWPPMAVLARYQSANQGATRLPMIVSTVEPPTQYARRLAWLAAWTIARAATSGW